MQTSKDALTEVKESYEDIMSSVYATPTVSQVPKFPPVDKSLDVPSTISGSELSADNTEALQDNPTALSTSLAEYVPPTTVGPNAPPSPRLQPCEADDVALCDDVPSEQGQGEHTVDVDPQPEAATAPALVAKRNLNKTSSVPADEPSSNAHSPSSAAADNGNRPSQGNEIIEEKTDARVEKPAVVAEETGQNGHAKFDDRLKPDATVAEPTKESLVETDPASMPDETTETAIHSPVISTEILQPSGPENTETGKGASADAKVVLEEMQANGHASAQDEHNAGNPT